MEWLRQLAVSGVEAGLVIRQLYVCVHGECIGCCVTGPVTRWPWYFGDCKASGILLWSGRSRGVNRYCYRCSAWWAAETQLLVLFSFTVWSSLCFFILAETEPARAVHDTLVGVFPCTYVAVGAALLMYVARRINIHMLENVLLAQFLR